MRRVLLLIPVVMYAAVVMHWNSQGTYEPTGDEPHYLVIADSVGRDADLDVTNNYETEMRSPRFYGHRLTATHSIQTGNASYSVHGVGLPLLLAGPVRVAGVSGARAVMLLITGLVPVMLFIVVRRLLASDLLALAVALTLSLGLPFLVAAGQIYPDMPSGLAILYLIELILSGRLNNQPSHLITGCIVMAFLPWLHLKNIAPALVLLAGLWLCSWSTRRVVVVFSTGLAVSLAGIMAYNFHAFGSVLGPYRGETMLWTAAHGVPVFLGLHWDQAHGLFLQQPLLLVSLLGLVPMVWWHPRASLFLGLVYLSILVPNAMHTNHYGGYSFVGRFMWSALPVWIYPFCQGFQLMRSARWRAGLLFAGAVWQLMLSAVWLHSGVLLNTLSEDNSLYPHAQKFLPAYHDLAAAWTSSPNYVFLIGGLILISLGWWVCGRTKADIQMTGVLAHRK